MERIVLWPRPAPRALEILWTDVRPLGAEDAAEWAETLPDDEQVRFRRFRHTRGAHEFLAGRLLVRTWLAALTGQPRNTWIFRSGPYGRPELDAPDWHFNLAHSGGIVACVLTRGREAGVDVEDLDRRAMDEGLWSRYCAPREVADILAQPVEARQERFLTYWTLKEAYLKARGLGIAVPLADIAFVLEPTGAPRVTFERSLVGTSTAWALGLTQAGPRHLLSWATPTDADEPSVEVAIHPIALDELAPR
jgi:4'-phosphopantetheinyl transferase